MKTFYMVYSNPKDGFEEDYNHWYSNTHLKEVLSIPGFISAQRLTLTASQLATEQPYKYLAMYEIDSNQVDETKNRLIESSSWMDMSDTLDDDLHVAIMQTC